jgi:hypothetical protein
MTDSGSTKKLQVFISHANEDNPAARRLYKRLKEDGFDPWLDEENLIPGSDWKLEIEKALRASDAILLCFSERSVAKVGFIQKEYKRAMDIQMEKPEGAIFVIPVRLDECEMPFFIRDLHWMDYPADYDRLLLSLQRKSGGTAMPEKTSKLKTSAPRTSSRGSRGKLKAPQNPGGPIFNVQGGIHIGRDMVAGGQVNYINETNLNISTPAQFMDELQKLKDEIEKLKSQPAVDTAASRRMDVVQADIQDAMNEAAKDKPVAERIKNTLDGAKETMEKLGGSIGAALNLGTMLGNLALLAIKLFGGG